MVQDFYLILQWIILSLLSDPGIVIARKLKCCECGKEFQTEIGIWKENELGWHHPDFVEVGKYPL